ncbi:unnamed protein product [Blepharisma stoltei]|uniref:AN1-type domain-containing protein n=1 Tax=Blepharisma stoltei TaxID=1481888 RepID=A0AAU9J3Q5_9CILI|nr:unnamed protein product [Blepharisma stoltei]
MESDLCNTCNNFFINLDGLCSACYNIKIERLKILKSLSDFANYFKQAKTSVVKKISPQCDLSKCWLCQKRIKSLNFICQCGYSFCLQHRIPEVHNCTFDYRNHGKSRLSKENPRVVAEKFTRI